MTLSRLLVAALLCAFALPATAGAAKKSNSSSPLTGAAAVGARYWGAVPCQGRIKVLAKQPLAAGVARDTDAWVTFDTPLGANNLARSGEHAIRTARSPSRAGAGAPRPACARTGTCSARR